MISFQNEKQAFRSVMIEINVLNLETYVLLAGIYEALGLVRFCLRKPLFYHDEQNFPVNFL